MKKFMIILLCSLSWYMHGSQTLPRQRNNNIIILNDTSENPFKNRGCFFWDRNGHFTVTYEMVTALLEGQTPVLASKSLWCTLRWFAQLWQDFATMSPEDLTTKYKAVSHMSLAAFQDKMNTYRKAIRAINNMYQETSKLINTHRAELPHEINRKIQNLFTISKLKTTEAYCSPTDPVKITCDDLERIAKESNVKDIFFLYLYFVNIKWSEWTCNEVNDDFLLFTPKSFTGNTTQSWSQLFNQPFNDSVVHTGLKGLNTAPFNHLQEVALMSSYQIKKFENLPRSLGPQLLDALHKTFTLKSDIKVAQAGKKETQRLAPWLLPSWNIYLGGHGSPLHTTAGMSIAGDNSDFNQLLIFLQAKIITTFFTYSSCYPAGSKLQSTFGFTSPASSKILSNLPYIIMALGVTLAPTTVSVPGLQIPPFIDYASLYQFIYISPDKSYGNFFPISQFLSFSQFFQNIKQKKYVEANNSIGYILDPYTKTLHDSSTHNMAMIKAPHTEWLTPLNFGKQTISIQQVAAVTKSKPIRTHPLPKEPHTPANSTKALLIFANYIPRALEINREMPQFIPMSIFSQNYYFENISAPFHSLTDIIRACFAIQGSQEEFAYYINNLTTNKPSTKYTIIISNKKNIYGLIKPTILYIQKTRQEIVKHYTVEIGTKITFTRQTAQSPLEVKLAIADGKKKAQQQAQKIISFADAFNPTAPTPEKVRRSRKQFEHQSKFTTATEILMDCNQVLQLI